MRVHSPASRSPRWRRRLRATLRRRPLLPFLLAATIAINLLLLGADKSWAPTAIAVGLAEAGLLGLWAGRIGQGWVSRLLMTAMGVAAISLWWCMIANVPLPQVLTFYSLSAATIAGTRAVIQLWRFWRRHDLLNMRFSVGGMMIGLTLAAVVAALSRSAQLPLDDLAGFAFAMGVFSLLPLLVDGIVQRIRRPLLALGGVLTMTVLYGVVVVSMLGLVGFEIVWWLRTILWIGALTGVWLIGLRSRGRRVRRRSARSASGPELRLHRAPDSDPPSATAEPSPEAVDWEV